jgi:hypothetical protein
MPGFTLPMADAIEAMAPNATTTAATSFHFAVSNFVMLSPLAS